MKPLHPPPPKPPHRVDSLAVNFSAPQFSVFGLFPRKCRRGTDLLKNRYSDFSKVSLLQMATNLRLLEPAKSVDPPIARNVASANEAELLEQWNEGNDGAPVGPVPSLETRWRGHRFLNFLLARMVFAFVISWFFPLQRTLVKYDEDWPLRQDKLHRFRYSSW